MELLIRSQDKKHLMKAEAIMYEETGTRYGLRVFTKNYDFNIATYKTEERVLEVLDEIQEAKLGNFHYKCPSNVKVSITEDTFVYEIPKE